MSASAPPVEAAPGARCAKGKIYRPSLGVCQNASVAARQGVRIKRKPSIRYNRPRAIAHKPQSTARVTYRDHVWNWVEINRSELIRTYGQ
jgi:hypothetical protein